MLIISRRSINVYLHQFIMIIWSRIAIFSIFSKWKIYVNKWSDILLIYSSLLVDFGFGLLSPGLRNPLTLVILVLHDNIFLPVGVIVNDLHDDLYKHISVSIIIINYNYIKYKGIAILHTNFVVLRQRTLIMMLNPYQP